MCRRPASLLPSSRLSVMSAWSTAVLAVTWYCLAVSSQLLLAHADLDYHLIPWCVLASSLLVYGLWWLHPLLPRGWKLTPPSPVPRVKSRSVQLQYGDEAASNDTETGAASTGTGEADSGKAAEAAPLLPASSSACTDSISCSVPSQLDAWAASSPSPLSSLLSLSGMQLDAKTADSVVVAAAAVCNVFYHASSLYVGLWIGDSSVVLTWRSMEPLLLHVIHSRQLTLTDGLQGGMLLYLLARWDKPADGDVSSWLVQRGLVLAGSAALCCCNHLLYTRCQSGEVGRSFFLRVAGFSLLLSLVLWAVCLPTLPVGSIVHATGVAFPLLSMSTAVYIFVGWLLLTHCTLELYSLLLMAKRGFVVNGLYVAYIWRQLQAALILASVTLSSLIECSKVSSQRRWSLLPILFVCCTALVQRAMESPHSYAALPLLPVSLPARHIAVISAAGNGNLGDNAQMDAWRAHLDSWTERTGVQVILHSWSRELCCSSYDDTLKHFLPSDPTSLTRLLKDTPPLDWIWIGGGGLLSCPHPPLNDADPAWQYHLLQRIELTRTRVAFMGLGAREPALVDLVHPLIEAAAYIGLRDTLSREVVAATQLNRTQIDLMHDPVLSMPPVLLPAVSDSVRVPTCWILMGDWQSNPSINMLVDSFLQPGEDLLLTMEAKDGNFFGRFNPDFVRLHDRDLHSFTASIAHCDFVISMRFHGAIIASQLGIPSLGLDMSPYTNQTGKMTALYSARELDRPDCVMYPAAHTNMTFVEVKTLHNRCRRHIGAREHLQRRMAAIQSQFQAQLDAVMAM